MKVWRHIRFFIYTALTILSCVFAHALGEHVRWVIGALMIFYGVETSLTLICTKKVKHELHQFVWALLEIMFGIIQICLFENSSTTCIIWGVWSIFRESLELEECISEFAEKVVTSSLSIIESVIIIAFSVLIIINPTEHHAVTHFYLLGLELITKVMFPAIDAFIDKYFEKQKEKVKEVIENAFKKKEKKVVEE